MSEPCTHDPSLLKQAMLYEPEEAMYCAGCISLVFADGHIEPVGVTKKTTTKR